MANRTECFSARSACAVLVLVLAACADSHSGPRGGGKSTETGNPPVIDLARVALVVQSDELHVVGKSGAVTPGGIDVEVTNLASDEVQRGDVARDGSFDVEVDGTLDDTYELRAVSGEGASRRSSAPVYLYRGGASVTGPDGGGVDGGGFDGGSPEGGVSACLQRVGDIQAAIERAEDEAARDCESNMDCQRLYRPAGCPSPSCPGPVVSSSAQAALASTLDAIAEQCASFEADGCLEEEAGALCPLSRPVQCVEGQCVSCMGGPCSPDLCEPCTTPSIVWSTTNGRTGAGPIMQHMLTGCSGYTSSTPPSDMAECTRELPCLGAAGQYAITHVQNALGDPVVQAALADHSVFGGLNRGGSYDLMVDVGDGTLGITGTPCGDDDGCVEPPQAVLQLRDVLLGVSAQSACDPESVCGMPFDAGTGSGSTEVYAFDVHIGACVPRVYTGEGGNANRFEFIEACMAACPTIAGTGMCEPGRVFVQNGCLGCGPAGGCIASEPLCAKPCADPSDCADDFGTCSPDGVCLAWGCD